MQKTLNTESFLKPFKLKKILLVYFNFITNVSYKLYSNRCAIVEGIEYVFPNGVCPHNDNDNLSCPAEVENLTNS